MTTHTHNTVLLEGTPLTAPTLSHVNHNTRFYRFELDIPRLSGQSDQIPILLPESLTTCIEKGSPLRLKGQMRSFNNRSGSGSRLVLTIFAQEILPAEGEPCNEITLSGTLCKPTIFRRTPLGRSICDLMVAVPRHYGRSDYLPVIAWGQLAGICSEYEVGDVIRLEGRVQSRTYRKVLDSGTETRVAYEVSMLHLLPIENVLESSEE